MTSIELVQTLNAFVMAITDIVDRNDSVVINSTGDAVLVSFNTPRSLSMVMLAGG